MVRSCTVDFGVLWEDGQVQYCRFLACSRKMIRPHQTAVEDCWLAPGRWSCPVLCGFLECSGKIDGQAPSDSCGGFLECLGSWLYPSHFIVPLSSPVSQDLNGSDGNPGVLVSVYVVCGGRLWVVCVHFISSLSTLCMYTHIHTPLGCSWGSRQHWTCGSEGNRTVLCSTHHGHLVG